VVVILIIILLAVTTFALIALFRVLEIRRERDRTPPRAVKLPDRPSNGAKFGLPVAKGLKTIMAADKDFDVKNFIAGAESAYEMIVAAFAEGDRQTLKSLLAPEVLEGFETAIAVRQARGEQVETRLVSIDGAEIISAGLHGKTAQIAMRFTSELISATRDRDGKVTDGNPDHATSVIDEWTFAKTVVSRDPNWKIVATKGGATTS
jgi:predicted lipid-binding transport protein (Tim44 family)